MEFEPLNAPEEVESPYNHGWRYWVASGAAVLLLLIGASLLSVLKGLLLWST